MLGLAVFGAGDAYAQQDRVWVQLEAHPDLQTADRRVRAYARVLPDVNGYRLRTGWYAIALGPYSETDGAAVLAQLRAQGAIPQDAYLSDREIYQQQFFPIGATTLEQGGDTTAPTITQPVTPVAPARETVAEARQSERLLSREEREALQIALQWFGHYNSGIDGAFGPGTRAGMTSWQEAQGLEPTGILTTGQRARLMADYQAALDALGMQRVRDERAGIEIDLPLAMVEFTRYEYPFAQYEAVGGSGIQVLLISQEGTAATLGGLYEIMQTLEIVPLEGERTRRQNSFVLTGQNDRLRSHTVARLEDGQIKGFTLVWTPERDSQMARVLDMMESSFQTFGGTLDPGAVDPGLDQGVDLMAGLDVRQPDRARSGFYIDGSGRVLTTAEAVQSCTRVMVDGRYEMAVSFSDPGLNVAVLQPTQALAPSTVAGFPTVPVRIRADVAVAGFPYDGVLDAASLNFGTVADMQGLDGDERIARLDVSLEPSEAGAPVLDATGAVVGMALPAPQTGRALPDGVSFALRGDQLAGILDQAGVTARRAPVDPQPMSRNALARYGANLAVLVTCWN
ncbi:serine protease [Nioella nitratireducens]|uniref:serine protease n=1 Tax=Nioella nitratireducens TaxID=1287720 RepID=UPI0013144953|nr:serine protease [Nioella nitratireducens]